MRHDCRAPQPMPARVDFALKRRLPEEEWIVSDRTVCVSTLGLKPGARLAQSVRRADGVVLLPAGAEVEIEQLRQLIQRGIDCVYVIQEDTRDAAQIERDIAQAEARVATLFRGSSGEARDELAAVIADYRRHQAS